MKNERSFVDAAAITEPATYGPTPRGVGFDHGYDFDGKTNALEGREALRAITQMRNKGACGRSLRPRARGTASRHSRKRWSSRTRRQAVAPTPSSSNPA